MTGDRDDPLVRKGALLLSSLVLTPDDALKGFRKRQTARPDVELEALKEARDLLDAIGFALRSTKHSDWQKLRDASQAMRGVKPPPPEDEEGPAVIPGAEAPPAPSPPQEVPKEQPSDASSSPVPTPTPSPVRTPAPLDPAPAPPAPAMAAPPPPPVPAPLPVLGADDAVPDGTAAIRPQDIIAAAQALPFSGKGAAPQPVADQLPPRDLSADETGFVVSPFEDEPIPFETKHDPPGSPKDLTLEQYASFCAECTIWPSQLEQVRRRYGLESEGQHRQLDDAWSSALTADGAKRAEFNRLVAQYMQWIKSGGV